MSFYANIDLVVKGESKEKLEAFIQEDKEGIFENDDIRYQERDGAKYVSFNDASWHYSYSESLEGFLDTLKDEDYFYLYESEEGEKYARGRFTDNGFISSFELPVRFGGKFNPIGEAYEITELYFGEERAMELLKALTEKLQQKEENSSTPAP